MKKLNKILISGLVLALALPFLASRATAADAKENLAIIVNPGVTTAKLTASELEAIFTSSQKNWSDGSNISTFSYAPEDPIRRLFDQVVLRMSPEEAARFWLDQRVRGGARPPRQVPDAALAVRLVGKLAGSIAYVPESLVNASVKVVARVRGGKVVDP
jgi:ABC-type phosphate transport system substrate-binding protein